MSSLEPEYSRIVTSIREFWELAQGVVHFAVKRTGYFHHYIVASWYDTKQKIYEYYVSFKQLVTSWNPGTVAKNDIDEQEIEQSIKNRALYVIEKPGYPKTKEEKDKAGKRFWGRWGEQAYSLGINNCEHLVNYILNGTPFSEQIEKIRGGWKMLGVDFVDVCFSNCKMNLLKLGGCLVSAICSEYFVKVAVNEVCQVAAKTLVRSSPSGPSCTVSKLGERICTEAGKKGTKFTSAQILASKECTKAANNAGKNAIFKSMGSGLLVTGITESLFAGYELSKLEEQRNKGHVNDSDFRREESKIVVGAVGATGGSVVGGALGQAFIPIPVLGYFVGSAMGNVIGRVGGRFLTELSEPK